MCDSARQIFQHSVEESGIERGFSRHLHYERGILQVCEDLYDLSTYSRVFVVSFGKAAHSSLEALVTRLGEGSGVTGIVCAPTLPATQFSASATLRAATRCRITNRCAPPTPSCARWRH